MKKLKVESTFGHARPRYVKTDPFCYKCQAFHVAPVGDACRLQEEQRRRDEEASKRYATESARRRAEEEERDYAGALTVRALRVLLEALERDGLAELPVFVADSEYEPRPAIAAELEVPGGTVKPRRRLLID